jgi:hypothetical protein
LVCCCAAGLGESGLLCLLPALLMASVLCTRRYPGERALLRWTRGIRDSDRARNDSARVLQPREVARVPRGSLLMGFALAVRPPPALALAS